jgi:hypothetical integral membrane protein (TIGR02206 family)
VQSFVAWSPLHWIMLAAMAALTAAAVGSRRRASDPRAIERIERGIGGVYLILWIGTFAWLRSTPDFDPTTDWPLQLCHWAAVMTALALAVPRRIWRTLAYFWGLALCTQAILTPNLADGPALWPFWFFWSTHAMCVAVPLYDVLARGYRPRWRDWAIACGAAAGYVAIVLPVNLATGWNYGFVGPSTPEVPTLVDYLGPWPLRLVWIGVIAAGAMALLMLPWLGRAAPITRTRGRSPPARRA